MARDATVADCLEILRENPRELSQRLPVEQVQLSFPTAGSGPRIKVSVRPGERQLVPDNVNVRIRGEDVSVPLEVDEDFQDYQLH